MNLVLVFSNEYIQLEVDQKLSYLQTTWLKQPSSAQFRAQLQQVTKYALTHQITKALFDIRQRAYLEMADQNWLTREILPLFKTRTLCFAYLISPTTLEALDVFRIKDALDTETSADKQMKMKLFLNKEEALAWLMEKD